MGIYEVCIRNNKYHEPSLAVVFDKIDEKYIDSDISYRGRYYYTDEERATKKLNDLCLFDDLHMEQCEQM